MTTRLPNIASIWTLALLVASAAISPRFTHAQPRSDDPPATYEVQIDGESFRVESNQRPVKVESRKGVTYNLAVRVALTQFLRLNSIQMEYGMWARVFDDKGKDIRIVQIVNDLGFTLRITDVGHLLNAEQQDKLLETLVDAAGRNYKEHKATELKKVGPLAQKFGVSSGKGTKITYKDDGGVGHTAMIFVLSGEGYTVAAEAEFRDQDFEDAMPWIKAALNSIRGLR